MKTIFNFYDFINEAYVQVPKVIEDFIDFMIKQPVVTWKYDPNSKEGWINKEHKLYSKSGIRQYLKEKYKDGYKEDNLATAIQYDTNIKIIKKKLKEKGEELYGESLELGVVNVRCEYDFVASEGSNTTPFYYLKKKSDKVKIGLTEEEAKELKLEYEEAFKKKQSKSISAKKEVIKASKTKTEEKKKPVTKAKTKSKKKNESLDPYEMLVECLMNL